MLFIIKVNSLSAVEMHEVVESCVSINLIFFYSSIQFSIVSIFFSKSNIYNFKSTICVYASLTVPKIESNLLSKRNSTWNADELLYNSQIGWSNQIICHRNLNTHYVYCKWSRCVVHWDAMDLNWTLHDNWYSPFRANRISNTSNYKIRFNRPKFNNG